MTINQYFDAQSHEYLPPNTALCGLYIETADVSEGIVDLAGALMVVDCVPGSRRFQKKFQS